MTHALIPSLSPSCACLPFVCVVSCSSHCWNSTFLPLACGCCWYAAIMPRTVLSGVHVWKVRKRCVSCRLREYTRSMHRPAEEDEEEAADERTAMEDEEEEEEEEVTV